MSRTLTLSDELYARLHRAARERGLPGIEQLLEEWQAGEEDRIRRAEAVRNIDTLRAQLFAIYGEMPDSVALIREDRER
ncbi:MAG TPA: hypothetical protein VG013_16340 [Gemmataceae bacterium]|jgi:hypothetical protein|nr:hypothetical protein [Gemmataceae bacterium]